MDGPKELKGSPGSNTVEKIINEEEIISLNTDKRSLPTEKWPSPSFIEAHSEYTLIRKINLTSKYL